MCFSATASFATSGILSIIGIFTLKRVQNKKLYPLAFIPIFFAIQQLSEALIWLALTSKINNNFTLISSYIFLFFALIFWPVWIPISLIINEKKTILKKFLYFSLITGIIFSSFSAYYILINGINTELISCHILYQINNITFKHYYILLYLLAIILPLFISTIKRIWILGLALLISFIISYIIYFKFLTSVWCFFAAILSILIYWLITQQKQNNTD